MYLFAHLNHSIPNGISIDNAIVFTSISHLYINSIMTKYGNTDEMQKLAWGDKKVSTPAIVTTIQNTVTSLINLALNKNDEFDTVPTMISDVANLVGSEILRNHGTRDGEMTMPQIMDMIKALLVSYRDQSPTLDGRWGSVFYI